MEERGCSDLKKGHEPRKVEDFQKLEKARKQILPKSLWKEAVLPDFKLLISKTVIKLCYFMPASLW